MYYTSSVKTAKASGLLNKWILFHSKEEFVDMVQAFEDAGFDCRFSGLDPDKYPAPEGDCHYKREYPCFGYVKDTTSLEIGEPSVGFLQLDICSAKEFVEAWEKSRKDHGTFIELWGDINEQ